MSTPKEPNAILTPEQVAAWLQISPRSVRRLGLPCLDLGHRTKRYVAADVLARLKSAHKQERIS